MRILALETDLGKLLRQYLGDDEKSIMTGRYSIFLFIMVLLEQIALGAIIFAVGVAGVMLGAPVWVMTTMIIVWGMFCVTRIVGAYIAWRFNIIFVTSRKVICVFQSLIHQRINSMNLFNLGSIISQSQLANIFNFGKIIFLLKSPPDGRMTLTYIVDAQNLSSKITECVANFQQMVPPHEVTGPEGKAPELAQAN